MSHCGFQFNQPYLCIEMSSCFDTNKRECQNFYLAERIYVEICSNRYPMIDIKDEYNVEYLMNFDKI